MTVYYFGGVAVCIHAVADPGFPVGGAPTSWGCRPLTHTLFSKNVCENERNGSCWGGGRAAAPPLDPPMTCMGYAYIL